MDAGEGREREMCGEERDGERKRQEDSALGETERRGKMKGPENVPR